MVLPHLDFHFCSLQDPYQKRKRANGDRKYCVIQCTGYLKAWSSSTASSIVKIDDQSEDEQDQDSNDFNKTPG